MNRLYSKQDLVTFLDDEFNWRVQELSEIRLAIRSTNVSSRNSLVRAGLAILYAHWEGFVKKSSEGLLNFVSYQGVPYRSLKPCFIAHGDCVEWKKLRAEHNVANRIALSEFFLSSLDKRATLKHREAMKTSNLNSDVFSEIAASVGIDPTAYETKFVLINKRLLERRNHVAHGKLLEIEAKDFDSLCDEVIGLIRHYKNDIENLVQQDRYLAVTNTNPLKARS